MCRCVWMYLPKSLVHTAMRTSSSEQGLHATKIKKRGKKKQKKENKNIKNIKILALYFITQFLSFVSCTSSNKSNQAFSCFCFSAFLSAGGCLQDIKRDKVSVWITTAGEGWGGGIIRELPPDPVSYKNSHKTPDTHSNTLFFPPADILKKVQLHSPTNFTSHHITLLMWVGYPKFLL